MATTSDSGAAGKPLGHGAKRRDPWRIVALVLTFVGVGYFLIESMLYRGISAWINEWQFARLGYALPVITFALLALLVLVPVWLIYWLIARRRRAQRGSATVAPMTMEQWRGQATRFRGLADSTAVGMALLALGALIWGMIVAGSAVPVMIGAAPGAAAPNGTRLLEGTIDERRAVTVSSSVILFRRQSRYAPLIEPGRPDIVRYIVELPGDPGAPLTEQGQPLQMVQGQVPGAATVVLDANGMRVARERFLISRSTASIQFPYRVGASLLLFAAFVAFAVGRLQSRRIRRIDGRAMPATTGATAA
jgi:hypothetical protein